MRLVFDVASGRFQLIDADGAVVSSTSRLSDGWRPGQALPGYDVIVSGHGRYQYTRNSDAVPSQFDSLGSAPQSFEITYNGKPWPPFPDLGGDTISGPTKIVQIADPSTMNPRLDPANGKPIKFAIQRQDSTITVIYGVSRPTAQPMMASRSS